MATKKKNLIFKSFEQFKAELFPKLSRKEQMILTQSNSKQIGASLADNAINSVLNSSRTNQ